MRLIDADRLKGTITGATPLKLWMKRTLAKAMDAMYETTEIIDKEPTVDAVAVVRCKDCAIVQHDELFGRWYCNGKEVKPDDYCSYGERINDERKHN